jgi:hypothetical protein
MIKQITNRVWVGFLMGYSQTRLQGHMSSGMSYRTRQENELFDHGANIGEAVGGLVNFITGTFN